ncbi:hypothetical protein MLD38_025304 [Melastoma candidum]|uniref:Uncharacterized protein n=1 Tax=Melastoma candidum TaxID=119954 RepID=A0ACB9NY23_9MYRT|nr:hypothetical protein MLD38_025304 [Melastoma candidum]
MSSANPRPPATGYPVPPQQSSAAPTNGYPYAVSYPSSTNNYYDPYAVPVPAPRRSAFLRTFLITLISLFLIAGAIMLIFWIVIRPRVPDFYVTSLSVSNYSVSVGTSTSVTATWAVTLRAVNPNKKIRISYEEVESSISYRDEPLAKSSIPPFYQGTGDTTEFKVGFADKDYYVSPRNANGMESDRTGHGSVAFEVRVRAMARLKAKGWWWTRMRIIRVICSGVSVRFTGNATTGGSGLTGQLNGGDSQCYVFI